MTNLVKGGVEFDCGHNCLAGFFAVNDLSNFLSGQNFVTKCKIDCLNDDVARIVTFYNFKCK